MEYSKIYDQLVQLEPAEQVLKEYYMKNHTFYPMERIPDLVSGADCSKWGITTRSIPALTDPLDMVTAFELLEEDYFSGDCDIRILKNFCYTQVGEHQHTFFEMMYMLKGTCENKIDGCDNNIQTGDLCIIPPSGFMERVRLLHPRSVFPTRLIISIMMESMLLSNTGIIRF